MRILSFSIVLVLSWAVIGSAPPYEGYDIIWEDSFEGPAGSLPDTSNWIMQDWFKDLNGDWQTYTTNPENQQLTGQGSLLIIPLRDSSATKGWTSGRLESAYTFTPAPGARTIAEASIKLGSAPASGKQGIWPAFWLLGDSHRRGTLIWPACGEIDIMENVNGETKTQGVIHCDKNPGGICNEKNGIPGAIALPDAGSGFHTYTAVIDRTPGNWMEESVTFFLDGVQYHQVTGAKINDEEVWGKIVHNLIHFILNVAVGGEWPGDPNESTMDGLENAMEVEYVAHFQSSGSGGTRMHQGIESGQREGGYGRVANPQFPQGEDFASYERPGHPSRPSSPGRHGAYYHGHHDIPVSSGAYKDIAPYEPSSPGFPGPQSPARHDLPAPGESYQRPGHKSPLPPFSQLEADNFSWLPRPAGFNADGSPIPDPEDMEHQRQRQAVRPEKGQSEYPPTATQEGGTYGQGGYWYDGIEYDLPGTAFDLTGTRWDPALLHSRRSTVNYPPNDDDSQPGYMPHENALSSEQDQSTYSRPGPGTPDYPQTQQREAPKPLGPLHNVQQHHSSSHSSVTEVEEQQIDRFTPDGSGQQQNTHEPPASAGNSSQQGRPAPIPAPMTDTQRENKPSPMNPTHDRYGSPDSSTTQKSHAASEQGQEPSPQYSKGDYQQAPEAVFQYPKDTSEQAQEPSSQYSQNDSPRVGEAVSEYYQGNSQQSQVQSHVFCLAPSAGNPDHGNYGLPGGWGPGTGKACPDSVTSMLKTRQISPSEEGNVESQNDSDSSKPAMPYRFKTPSYPPPPAPDAIAPPTVSHGEFGGVQAKDKGKYLDRGMPYRFTTPRYPPAPAPDAAAPPTVTPGEYGGVHAKDEAKYLDSRGVDEAAPVSGQGTPGYANPNQVSMVALVPVVVAIIALF